MRICRRDQAQGRYRGQGLVRLPVALGYADRGVHDPHVHDAMYEVYLVARGTSTALVSDQRVDLEAGDMLVVEPGESHTFEASSDDYFHFVVQAPFVGGDKRLM